MSERKRRFLVKDWVNIGTRCEGLLWPFCKGKSRMWHRLKSHGPIVYDTNNPGPRAGKCGWRYHSSFYLLKKDSWHNDLVTVCVCVCVCVCEMGITALWLWAAANQSSFRKYGWSLLLFLGHSVGQESASVEHCATVKLTFEPLNT